MGLGWAFLAAALAAMTQEDDPFEREVRPILARHCYGCHSAQAPKVKGDLRLDRLSGFSAEPELEQWRAVLERVGAGEMPPESKPRPAQVEIRTLSERIRERLEAADARRRAAEGRVVFRRLNRIEYENTLKDLLGIEIDLQDLLPPDTSAHGFDNVGEALQLSSFLMERYLEAADKALGLAIANRPQPPVIRKRYSLKDSHQVRTSTERVYRVEGDTVVLFSSSHWNAVTVHGFYPPDRGRYRFRIFASGAQSGGKPVVYRVDAGPMLMGTRNRLVGYFDAPPGEPGVTEFIEPLEARSTLRLHPYGLATAQVVSKIGARDYTGPGLAVHGVEVEGPLHESWPPPSHRRIFGDLPQAALRGGRLEVVSKEPLADAERVLRPFLRRAFRRAVSDADVAPFLALARAKMDEGHSFEQAVRVALAAVLVAPEFLFLRERPGPLDDFALASRLSYFLWSSMPDDELLALAEQGKLRDRETLRRQVERLFADPPSQAFTRNFVGQWLGLRDIDFTEPSHILHPEHDDMLKVSMVRETELFFAEVLREDLGIENFVASDFTMLNGRLARHYGIPGVEGWGFRRVALPEGSRRGGVLTMASVLKVTANGTSTSPVLRGAWVLDRILGTPPSPPPPGIPAVEPDIRGATTPREQLAKHRQMESCASCHSRIDPPGFALESFDVIGGWREHYRTTGRGQPVVVDGRRLPYLRGPKVDPSDVLPDGRKFRDIDEFKRLLLGDVDKIARGLARRLATYATGGAPGPADEPEIDRIVRRTKERGYGLRTMIHEIVQSRLFREK